MLITYLLAPLLFGLAALAAPAPLTADTTLTLTLSNDTASDLAPIPIPGTGATASHGQCSFHIRVTQVCRAIEPIERYRHVTDTMGTIPFIVNYDGHRLVLADGKPAFFPHLNDHTYHLGWPQVAPHVLNAGGVVEGDKVLFSFDECHWREDARGGCGHCNVGGWTAPDLQCESELGPPRGPSRVSLNQRLRVWMRGFFANDVV